MANMELFNSTKLAAYFLWEATKCENALGLWHCAEEISSFLERSRIDSPAEIASILQRGKMDQGYIYFVRHIAFRIYLYTAREDALANWYDAERLVADANWQQAAVALALLYRGSKANGDALADVKSDAVRAYYR